MGITRTDAKCPFPGRCKLWGEKGCKVTDEEPLILCSLAELERKDIELTEKGIGEYLDRHIQVWAQKENCTKSEFAKFYVDAYQKVRKDLLGEELKIEQGPMGRRILEEYETRK